MLESHKEQKNVERGFRFIKSVEFHLDGTYLHLPSRIDGGDHEFNGRQRQ